MAQIQTSLGVADVNLDARAEETGFSSIPFSFSASTTTTIWEALDSNNLRIGNIYGTVTVIGDPVTGTTRIAVNGINTTQIIDGETFAVTSDPLNHIVVTYTTGIGATTSLSVSLATNKFEY